TGQALFDEAQMDKRTAPVLKEPERFPDTRLKVLEDRVNLAADGFYEFRHVGEELPWFRAHRFLVSTTGLGLQMTSPDRKPVWSQALSPTLFSTFAYYGQPSYSHPFTTLGHTAYLTVGHKVFALDPIGRRVLWEKDLHAPAAPGDKPMVTPII